MTPSIEFMIVAGLVIVLIAAVVWNMALVLRSNKHIVDIALTDRRRHAQRWDGKKAQDKVIKELQKKIAAIHAVARQQAREAGGEGMSERLAEDQRQHDLSEQVSEDDIGTGCRRNLRSLG